MAPPRGRTAQIGALAEDRALEHLLASGLQLLDRNVRCKVGEIDLVMQAGARIVFVEVRARRRVDYGTAAATITRSKQMRVRKAAQLFLQRRFGARRWPQCRFDVVTIDAGVLEWLPDAF